MQGNGLTLLMLLWLAVTAIGVLIQYCQNAHSPSLDNQLLHISDQSDNQAKEIEQLKSLSQKNEVRISDLEKKIEKTAFEQKPPKLEVKKIDTVENK